MSGIVVMVRDIVGESTTTKTMEYQRYKNSYPRIDVNMRNQHYKNSHPRIDVKMKS